MSPLYHLQHHVYNAQIFRHAYKQKHVTYSTKTRQSVVTDKEMTQMLELDKNFDLALTNMFKNKENICVRINKK